LIFNDIPSLPKLFFACRSFFFVDQAFFLPAEGIPHAAEA